MFRRFAWVMLASISPAIATEDLRISQLQQDVRDLQRQVRAQASQIEALRARLALPGPPGVAPGRSLPREAPAAGDAWLDARKWERVRAGMPELEVIALLGPPTSMRANADERVLLYAMEIGSSGFLGGSVTMRGRVVAEVQTPVLR